MFVQYNRPNNHVLSTHGVMAANGVMTQPDIAVLRPGWQEFPKHIFDMHKDEPSFKKLMAEGVIVVSDAAMGTGKKAVKVGQADVEVHLSEIKDEKKCIEIVNGTFDRELFQRWLDEETRSKVKRAISARIKELYGKKDEE